MKRKNYWWKTRLVEPVDKGTLRSEYIEKIQNISKLDRIICLTGIRRCGKTTILFQYIDYLLKISEPNKIIYIKIDDLIGKIDSLHDVLNIYHELTGVDPSMEAVYFLLDEIHVHKGWQSELKYYIDSHAKCKFIISGSSKTLLYLEASESLAGRITFIDVFPLTFREYLHFNDMILSKPDNQFPSPDNFDDIEKAFYSIIEYKHSIIYYLGQYFNTGGFPEWFKIKDIDQWYRTIVEDYFALILFKDIVSVFRVKDPLLLDTLVRDIASFSTNRFSYKGLSDRLGVNRETLKLYLYYLQSSMMVFVADVYTPSNKAVEKREKKLYFWEEGLRRALTLDKDDGKTAENIVAWHLIKRGCESKPYFRPFYWKNKHEVDFVYADSHILIPVEVKYKEQIKASDIKGLIEFLDLYNLESGVVVTKDLFKIDKIGRNKGFFYL
ncbi:MAG: ATP-binding protein [Methanosarcinales archaeon]|nr:ATP-binding protein [Methanosarcinales archaeon]